MSESSPNGSLSPGVASYVTALDSVKGWLEERDVRLMAEVDRLQKANGVGGNVLEIGAYQGKSAILLGFFLRPTEELLVCDVFGDNSKINTENKVEGERWYDGYCQSDFERSYLRFHPELPTILAMPSTHIDREGLAGKVRLVHIDGSHNYDVVREDIVTTRTVLGKGGIAVFDDWSTAHNPGVALAIWEEVLRGEMQPLCLTRNKMYASWDAAGIGGAAPLEAWALSRDLDVEVHHLAGWPVLRFSKRAVDMPVQVANADLQTARSMLSKWGARVAELEMGDR